MSDALMITPSCCRWYSEGNRALFHLNRLGKIDPIRKNVEMLFESKSGNLSWVNYDYDSKCEGLVTNWLYKGQIVYASSDMPHGKVQIQSDVSDIFHYQYYMIKAITRKLWLFLTKGETQHCYSWEMFFIFNEASAHNSNLKKMLVLSTHQVAEIQTLPRDICCKIFEFWNPKSPETEYDSEQIYDLCEGVLFNNLYRSDERVVTHYMAYEHHNDPQLTSTIELQDGEWVVTETIIDYSHTKYYDQPSFTNL